MGKALLPCMESRTPVSVQCASTTPVVSVPAPLALNDPRRDATFLLPSFLEHTPALEDSQHSISASLAFARNFLHQVHLLIIRVQFRLVGICIRPQNPPSSTSIKPPTRPRRVHHPHLSHHQDCACTSLAPSITISSKPSSCLPSV